VWALALKKKKSQNPLIPQIPVQTLFSVPFVPSLRTLWLTFKYPVINKITFFNLYPLKTL